MSKYLKNLNNKTDTSSSNALKRVRKNVFWQAGLAFTTIVLTIVIIFAMTAAWYTNVVQTSGLVFEAEAWGFDGNITLADQAITAAPGDEGNVYLEVSNTTDSMASVGVTVSKTGIPEAEMRQRLFFYVDTQLVRNGETMDRVYLNSLSTYTYTLFGGTKLTLSEDIHNDASLKWQWVYDMLGYYVLCEKDEGNNIVELEYLRPIEYDYDQATFEYETLESGHRIIRLKTVDGKTGVADFLAQLSDTDGFETDISTLATAEGYYPVEVDGEGYGVYVYLCTPTDVEIATDYDTELGMRVAAGDVLPPYPVSVTVAAQKTDENIFTVDSLDTLMSALDILNGVTIQLTNDIHLGALDTITLPADSKFILDLNGNKILYEGEGNAIDAEPDSSVIIMNGEIQGIDTGTGIFTAGAEVTLNKVKMSGFTDCVFIKDNEADNEGDSRVRMVDCELTGKDSAIYVSGNGLKTEQTTQVIIEKSTLKSDVAAIWCSGDDAGNGRWGTDIQVIDSTVENSKDVPGTAIYHPQKNSTLTVYNSTITGYTGMVIKGGTVSVKASTVLGKGPGEEADFDANGNPKFQNSGYADTGDGIYIETNYGYQIRLEISGANVTNNGVIQFRTSLIGSEHGQSLRVFEKNATNVAVRIVSGKFKELQETRHIAEGSSQKTIDETVDNFSYKAEVTGLG